jgi:hypothetical protein
MRSARFVATFIAAAFFIVAGPFSTRLTADEGALPLVGTWWTTVTPPPESGAPPFTLLLTFTGDGNLLATGTAGDAPALGNPCHGAWASRRGREFGVTYLCFDFDATLQQTGVDKIRGTLTVDRSSHLTGTLGLTHYDTAGNEIFSACCAAIAGTRVVVEPQP